MNVFFGIWIEFCNTQLIGFHPDVFRFIDEGIQNFVGFHLGKGLCIVFVDASVKSIINQESTVF